MTIPKGRYMFGLLATVAMLLIMSACSLGSGSTGSGSKTGAQILQNTANTMKQLKAIHLNMQVNTQIGAVGLTPTPGSTTPTNINLNINANGDAVMPGQTSLKLNISGFSGLNLNLAEILKGDKAYIQNSKGQWYIMDKSRLLGSNGSSNPLSSASVPNFNQLIDIGQHAQLTDHGDQSLNGQNLRQITVTLDKNALKDLLNSTGQLKGLTGSSQRVFEQFKNSIKNFQATLDFWIDESTSYLRRVEMKLNLNLDTRSFATPGTTSSKMPPAVTLRSDTIVDLSRFNDPSITITAPANTIPTDNPSTIFSSSQQ
jgi:hypothetical protein